MDRDPRRRAPARCASTPSIPATCARSCTRRPSRARTSPTAPLPEESVPALLALLDGELHERALPRARPDARRPAHEPPSPSSSRRRSRPPRRPRPAACSATRCACMVAERGSGRIEHAQLPRPALVPATPATCSSSTRRRRCPRRCRPRAPTARRSLLHVATQAPHMPGDQLVGRRAARGDVTSSRASASACRRRELRARRALRGRHAAVARALRRRRAARAGT